MVNRRDAPSILTSVIGHISLLQLADLQKPYFFSTFSFFRNKKGNIDFNLNRWLKWQIANDKWSQTTHVDGYYQIAIQIDPGLYSSYILRRSKKYIWRNLPISFYRCLMLISFHFSVVFFILVNEFMKIPKYYVIFARQDGQEKINKWNTS